MPINTRILKDGRKRYEARLNRKGPGWCHRFWTLEEAEKKLESMKKQHERKKYQGKIVNEYGYNVDIKALYDFFLLGKLL